MSDVLAYSVPDAAKAIGVSARTLWKDVASGSVRTFWHGRRRLIDADDLRAFVKGLRATSPGQESGPIVHEDAPLS